MTARYDVCIVSSSCLSSGPRVEKEADALAAAGYRVAVLVTHSSPWMPEWDARLAHERAWTFFALGWLPATRRRSLAGLASAALHRAAHGMHAALAAPPAALATLALSDRVAPLAVRAARIPAALYVAHNLAALPAAAYAARVRGVPFAFDAEDDHYGELPAPRQRGPEGRLFNAIMSEHLPRAAYVTAASDGIAEALAARYAIERPTTVHNVFPLRLRGQLDGRQVERSGEGLSLCWYSQTVGLDRGLQDAIAALGHVRGEAQLHIRGHAPPEVEAALRTLARRHGVEPRIHFYPQVHPDDLLSRVAEHDVGLALEQPANDNRLIAVTNKLFFYMLAGLATIATDTPGQRAIAVVAGDAVELYPPGDAAALARCLQRLIDDRALLTRRKQRALELALTRFNAERELRALPPLVARVLQRGAQR